MINSDYEVPHKQGGWYLPQIPNIDIALVVLIASFSKYHSYLDPKTILAFSTMCKNENCEILLASSNRAEQLEATCFFQKVRK